jgi:hypothetical protein
MGKMSKMIWPHLPWDPSQFPMRPFTFLQGGGQGKGEGFNLDVQVVKGDYQKGFNLDVQVVKGDYQKADAATVPDHLWVRSFVQGYAQEGCVAAHLTTLGLPVTSLVGEVHEPHPPSQGIGWAASLKIYRDLGLRWWQRNLVWGFTRWRRAHIKINKGCLPGQMVGCSFAYRANRGVSKLCC